MKKIICNPRILLGIFIILGISLLLGLIAFAPAQGPVIAYKVALVMFAAICGMIFDFLAFPYSLPSGYLDKDWRKNPDATGPDGKADYPVASGCIMPFCASLMRRAIIIFGFIIAVALGL